MFKLPDLPYDRAALEPVISARTLGFHHDKHHAKYVETLNALLSEAEEAPADLESLIRRTHGDPARKKLFNNAAQTWNHTFFWTCMSPQAQEPSGPLADAIVSAFGDREALKTRFVEAGAGHFGSGWVWLAAEGATLKILATHDADDALTQDGVVPLLVCDLWEHAYYLDYQNKRDGFLGAWFDALPNWAFAGRQYAAACGDGPAWKHPAPQ